MSADVIVVGGGVIGCSIALKLASDKVKVAVIERGGIGGEASRAAAGMLSPQTEAGKPGPFFDLCLRSRKLYPEFTKSLSDLTGLDTEYRDEGTLCIALEPDEQERQHQQYDWQFNAGLRIQSLDDRELTKIEPAITPGATGALFLPDDHQVDNRRLMDALAAALDYYGVELRCGVGVESLSIKGNRVTGVMTRDGKAGAGHVVIAGGCWSGCLLEQAGVEAGIVPARGQMIALGGKPAPISRVIHAKGCYLVPRRNGRTLIGSSTEYTGYDKSTTPEILDSLLSAACRAVPALSEYEVVESWCGLRPDTADHLPVLGNCGIDNLVIATGHFRNGILLAPITAELIVETIRTGMMPAELEPFAAGRFLRLVRS
jgi:glycine oxidase